MIASALIPCFLSCTFPAIAALPALSAFPAFLREAAEAPSERRSVYDEKADASADIAKAVARARKANRRVLIQYGANWCGWCHKLQALFQEDADVRKVLSYEYEVVRVDVGRFDKNIDLATKYGADVRKGIPYLTVLDAEGKPIANQETGSLEVGDRHDPAKVKAFLSKWAAEPVDAGKALEAALAEARRTEKRVFLHLGAPWCGWCKRLETLLEKDGVKAPLAKDHVVLEIDVERMRDGAKVAEKLRPDPRGGIPWIAILDADGKKLATSDAGGGNIGCPATPEERAHFMEMLRKTARRMTAEDLAQVEREVTAFGKEILGRTGG